MADTTTPGVDESAPAESLGEKGIDALRRERDARRAAEARLKDLEPLAAKAAALEEAGKTEAQRAAEALAEATGRAEAAEARVLRHEVAAAQGLPPSMAARLVGSTRDELVADAIELAGQLTPADRPLVRPDPTQGGSATGGAVPLNGDPLLRALTAKLGIR